MAVCRRRLDVSEKPACARGENRTAHSRIRSPLAMKVLISTLALSVVALASTAEAFECPTAYTLTSADCASFCTNATIPSDGCLYYPTKSDYGCADSSVGYCTKTSSADCSVKCLAQSFFTDDTVALGDGKPGKALTLGLRGKEGSFGRSEPVEVVQNLALSRVTKLTIKDFLIDSKAQPSHHIAVLTSTSKEAPVLQTLELVNVNLDFATSGSLPSTLVKLVLNNNALSLSATPSLRQDDNATSHFPLEIFSMKSLKQLDLRGNPALQKTSFSSEQLAFFKSLTSFSADFTL